MEDPTCFLN